MSKPQSTNGSESEFEFVETPKAPTPTFEKFEECGVRTTAVSYPTRTCLLLYCFAAGLVLRETELPPISPEQQN